ncbi:MAG: dynamin family protein [Nitrospirae bacterium]|nr:dynamin family protein [Nitrospirota bacterium]
MPETSSAMSSYSLLKEELLRSTDEMLAMESIRGCPCEELREKIETNTFNLVVVGQFKRGKTSLINALLGADILPVAVVPLTSIVTIMKYGEALRITVHFNDGRVVEIKPESLPEYVTERGNPKNQKDVSEVIITYPSPYLKGGVQIIDTPGVGSVYEHNTDVAYQYLPKSDAALFLLSVDQPLSKAELDFLGDVREYSNRIFFLLNKTDYFCEADLRESMDFSKNVLREAMGMDVRIFPVSAKLALEGKLSASDQLVMKSLLPQFSSVLSTFLMEEKGKILLLSVANNLLRLLSQARFELDLEMKSLATPLDELRAKILKFEEKKKEVLLEKTDFDILLDGEIKRISKNMLDEDLTAYGNELRLKAEANLEQYREDSGLSLKELKKLLEGHIISEVRQAVNAWRGIEDEKLAKTFETVCRRFITKIDETVDSLLKFSSELFAVPYEAVKAEALWSTKSRFYYKFMEQPVGLEIITSSVTLALPKFIGEKIILKKMKEYLHRVITMQLARIGSDFEERLDKSKLDFRWEMLQRIEATIEGISAAIEKGTSQRSKSEKEANERKNQVTEILARFDDIKDRLMKLREDLSVITKW